MDKKGRIDLIVQLAEHHDLPHRLLLTLANTSSPGVKYLGLTKYIRADVQRFIGDNCRKQFKLELVYDN